MQVVLGWVQINNPALVIYRPVSNCDLILLTLIFQFCFAAPFVSRPSFKRGIIGFTNASLSPLVDAFTRFSKENISVVFIGDSTMRQKLMAMECELLRENHRNRLHGEISSLR